MLGEFMKSDRNIQPVAGFGGMAVSARRLIVEELALGQMAYSDTTAADGTGALIRFDITFALPAGRSR